MDKKLTSAYLFAEAISNRNDTESESQLLYEICSPSMFEPNVVVRIRKMLRFYGNDVQFILDTADILRGEVTFEQNGEINVRFGSA